MRFTKARRGAVIHHDAILAQHQAVPCPANRQFGKAIAIDAVQKHCRISALYINLAKCRHVTHAD